jgi:hypothetical protein
MGGGGALEHVSSDGHTRLVRFIAMLHELRRTHILQRPLLCSGVIRKGFGKIEKEDRGQKELRISTDSYL